MSDDRSTDRDNENADRSATDGESDSSGFRLEAGLRPLADLLGNLVEATITDASPPSEETIDWSAVNEDRSRRSAGGPQRPADRDRTEHPRTKRRRSTPADKYLVDTRREDGELVVAADVPGVSKDELAVGIDPRTNELVIAVNETVLERVEPPWQSVEATQVWIKNGVLEVRLRPNVS